MLNNEHDKEYKKYFYVRLINIGKLFDYEISKEKAKLYFEIISKTLNIEEFKIACDNLESEWRPEYGIKFPLPADFINIIKNKQPEPECLFDGFYSEAQKAVSQGKVSSVGDDDFKSLIKAEGGQFNLSQWTVQDWKWNRGRLKNAYLAKIKREESEKFISGNEIKLLLNKAISK